MQNPPDSVSGAGEVAAPLTGAAGVTLLALRRLVPKNTPAIATKTTSASQS